MSLYSVLFLGMQRYNDKPHVDILLILLRMPICYVTKCYEPKQYMDNSLQEFMINIASIYPY